MGPSCKGGHTLGWLEFCCFKTFHLLWTTRSKNQSVNVQNHYDDVIKLLYYLCLLSKTSIFWYFNHPLGQILISVVYQPLTMLLIRLMFDCIVSHAGISTFYCSFFLRNFMVTILFRAANSIFKNLSRNHCQNVKYI